MVMMLTRWCLFIILSGTPTIITHTIIIIISDSHVTLFPVPYDNDTDIEENPGSQKLVEEQELQDLHLMV